MRLDELLAESPPVATPPGAGARRASAVPVRVAVLEGMRLCVDLNSPPENIWRPEASVGPDEELPEVPDERPSPEDEDDDPPPEPDDPDDEDEDDDDPVVVRGTAWPAMAGTANPIATRNVSARIDVVMACSQGDF